MTITKYYDKTAIFVFGNGNGSTCLSVVLGNTVLNLGSVQLEIRSTSSENSQQTFEITSFKPYGTYVLMSYDDILATEWI